jgi:hypothetical protein
LAAVALGVYIFRLTRSSLHVAFSPDDITNIYRAYSYPIGMLVRANLLFFETSPFFRPFTCAWYLTIFHFAGTNPVPYHVINLLVMAANAFLTYSMARRLSGSRETGWLAALLAAYHLHFNGLYFDTAFIFDVLCYFFFFSAFLLYVRIRQQGRYLRTWELAACCGLYICALNSKELALTLPLFLGLYELLYHPPARWRPIEWRWLTLQGRGMLVTGILTLAFVIGRATGEFVLMRNPAYRPQFTWDQLMLTSRQFLGVLFFVPNQFTSATVVLLWSAMAAVAWLSKSKTLQFAWLFLMLSPAPVAFVEPRGAAQYYIVLFGWALYFAAALAGLTRFLFRPLPAIVAQMRAPVLMAAVLLLLYPYYKALGHDNNTAVSVDGVMLQSLMAQIRALHPTLPQGSHFLLLNETDQPAWDTFLAAVRLIYHDHDIRIDRARRMDHKISASELVQYDYVLDYRGGRLLDVPLAPDPRVKPMVLAASQGPEIYHADWSLVSSQNPGRRGETLIAKVSGLGATVPDVGAGQPFPAEPLLSVGRRVGVKLNGLHTPTINAFGWPQTINTYRVDFRIPDAVKPGLATLELSVQGVLAPAVQFPVR